MLDFKIDLYILWLFLGSGSILVSPLKMISSCLFECLMAFPQLTLRFLDSPDFETLLDFRTVHMSGINDQLQNWFAHIVALFGLRFDIGLSTEDDIFLFVWVFDGLPSINSPVSGQSRFWNFAGLPDRTYVRYKWSTSKLICTHCGSFWAPLRYWSLHWRWYLLVCLSVWWPSLN